MEDDPRMPTLAVADAGRRYNMGRMLAIFRADGDETGGRYSISEWWLEPRTRGPGAHAHDDDHIFYVIEGALSLQVAGRWLALEKGGCAVIPGGTPHDFANRGENRAGFVSLNMPGGFEHKMPGIAAALAAEDLRLDR